MAAVRFSGPASQRAEPLTDAAISSTAGRMFWPIVGGALNSATPSRVAKSAQV
jgi:hypothetical protein